MTDNLDSDGYYYNKISKYTTSDIKSTYQKKLVKIWENNELMKINIEKLYWNYLLSLNLTNRSNILPNNIAIFYSLLVLRNGYEIDQLNEQNKDALIYSSLISVTEYYNQEQNSVLIEKKTFFPGDSIYLVFDTNENLNFNSVIKIKYKN